MKIKIYTPQLEVNVVDDNGASLFHFSAEEYNVFADLDGLINEVSNTGELFMRLEQTFAAKTLDDSE